jgi:CRP-like cAMP-binding protein/chromosome segregation ATPase
MPKALSSDDLQSLRGLVPLHTLPDDVLERLIEHVTVETVKPGEVLFNQGDTDHDNVYLIKGRVALLSKGSVVERVESGTETARFPLAHQLPRKYTARADTKSRVTRIDSRQLSDFLARSRTEDYQVSDLDDASEDDWMSLLLQSRVLQQVPASNIQRVMMSVEQVEVSKGDDLIRQGDPGDYYYMLTRGRAVVRRDNGDGKGVVDLATLGPGDAFGEEALLSDNPRNSTVTMLHDGHVLRLSKENFLQLIHNPLLVQVDPETAQSRIDEGAVWLDLRGVEPYDASHREGAINLPFESLRYQTGSLAPDRHYVIYSDTTTRAMAGAFLLTERGFDVSVLNQPYADASTPEPETEPEVDVAVSDSLQAAPLDEDSGVLQRAHEAEQRAQQLEEQLAHARRDREAVEAERAQHLAQVRDAVSQARRKLLETEEQKRQALEGKQQAYSDMERLTSNLESLQNERASLVERMSEIEGLDKQLQARLAKAERELIGERERAESATHNLEELSQRLANETERREQERQQHAREQGELKEELTALHMEVEQANFDLDEMREKLAASAAATANDSDAVVALEAELQQLRDANTDVSRERDGLAKKLTALEQQLAAAGQDSEAAAAIHNEQLTDLQQQLESTRRELEQQVRSAQQRLDETRAAGELVQQALDEANAERDKLRQALEAAEGREKQVNEGSAELEQRFEALAGEADALRADLETTRADRDAARKAAAANESAQGELQQAQAELAQSRNDLRENQAELSQLRAQHAQLQTELAAGNQEAGAAISQAQARAAELESRLQDKETELAQQRAESVAEIDAVERQLSAKAEALEAEQQSVVEQRAETDKLRDVLAAAEGRIVALESGDEEHRRNSEQALAERDEALQSAQQASAALEVQLQDARAALADAETRIADFEAREASTVSELGQQQDAVASRDAEIGDLQSQLAEANAVLQSLQSEHESLVGSSDEKDAALAAAQAQYDADVETERQARQAAEQQLETLTASLLESQSQSEEMQRAIDSLRDERDASLADRQSVADRQAGVEAELAQLRDKNTELVAALESAAQASNEGDGLRQELAAVTQKLEERELALSAAREEQAELIEALNTASADRETLQLSLNDNEAEQARLVDLENQVAELTRSQQRETLRHEQQRQLLEEQLDKDTALRAALEEEVARLTQLVEEDAETDDGDVRAERDELQAELVMRENEVEQLRGVIEEYVDHIRAAQSGGGDAGEIDALRAELEMVREQAIRDVAQMREQLATAERQQRRLQEADGREAVSHEAMRQKIEELEATVAERQRDLIQADSSRHMLEDQLEDANTKIDVMRREMEQMREDADQAVLARREAEVARSQLQDALAQYEANADEARTKDLRDDRLQGPTKPIGIDNVASGGRMVPLLLGAGLVIGALEAATFATGNGEFFTLLMRLLGS